MRCVKCGKEFSSDSCTCGFCPKQSTILFLSKVDQQNISYVTDTQPVERTEIKPDSPYKTGLVTPPVPKQKNDRYIWWILAGIVLVFLMVSNASSCSSRPSSGNTVTQKPSIGNSSNQSSQQVNSHEHVWQNATCITPKTCKICGVQLGGTGSHQWNSATHTAPKTCQYCLRTEGLSLGTWITQLAVLSDTQSEKNTDITVGHMQDNAGRTYNNAIKFWVSNRPDLINTEHIVYLLDGDYNLMEATIAIGADSDDAAAVSFYIYGDDKLLYHSEYISGTQTQRFQLDVTGVRSLRIECETFESCRYSYGILSADVFVS
jgi:hypothetical protein